MINPQPKPMMIAAREPSMRGHLRERPESSVLQPCGRLDIMERPIGIPKWRSINATRMNHGGQRAAFRNDGPRAIGNRFATALWHDGLQQASGTHRRRKWLLSLVHGSSGCDAGRADVPACLRNGRHARHRRIWGMRMGGFGGGIRMR